MIFTRFMAKAGCMLFGHKWHFQQLQKGIRLCCRLCDTEV